MVEPDNLPPEPPDWVPTDEDSFDWSRTHSKSALGQEADRLGFALGFNAWTRYLHQKREAARKESIAELESNPVLRNRVERYRAIKVKHRKKGKLAKKARRLNRPK